ncbi:DnaD domain protein [Paenibacillus sediminis]|uniref:Replication initiation and membrane attachment protein n=1 Tax=Paenibacillus sediminis TaxID=664909 RepID=A0ABS4H605_9BACL|nr:DnaD domain protein [Paenibacillus sediminis]MBP1937916.1 replication initiation and membrane attachment protein [Paenibacillus sediminis]
MRMKSLLHFTENHRYCVYRDFSLSALDSRMLSMIYQPMVGAFAISFYQLLFQHIPLEQVGYSRIEQQRRLFLTLGLEPSEKGRKYVIEQASKLEAVGLLQTSRVYIPENDDYIYEYELQPPLSPAEFFKTQHLTLLLRDKIGKFAVLSLREQLWSKEPEEWAGLSTNKENISHPFYDIFELNTHVIDYELEQALAEVATSRQPGLKLADDEDGVNYADIILRFPRESANRAYVEKLRYNHEQMGIVNYVVRKYNLSLQDICRLLDEDGIFTPDGDLMFDELQHKASLHFRQGKKRQEERQVLAGKVELMQQRESETAVPLEHAVQMEYYLEVPQQFQSKCDIHQYNMMLRNEPYTRMLQTFFPGSVPDNFLDIFEKIDLSYKLPGEVINVLIHYLMSLLTSGSEQRINRNFVEAIASNMLLKQVNTYEKAVEYIREQSKVKSRQAAGTYASASPRTRSYNKTAKSKPEIPIVQSTEQGETVSEEEFAALIRMAEQMQASKKKDKQ